MIKAACGALLAVLAICGTTDAKQIASYHENGRDYIKCTCTDSTGGYTTSCYSHSTCDGCCGAHGTGGVSAPLGAAGPFPDRPCKEAPLVRHDRERVRVPVAGDASAKPVTVKDARTKDARSKQAVPVKPPGD